MADKNETCRAWGTLRGCRRGDECKFKHEGEQGAAARARVSSKGEPEPCKGWSSENGCRYGSQCPYSHQGPGKLFVEKSKEEKAKEVCRNWKSAKGCKAKDCPYLHEGETGKVEKPAKAAAAADGEKKAAGSRRRRGGRGAGKKAGNGDKKADEKKVEKKPREPLPKSDEACENWKSDKGCWKGADCRYKHVGPTGNPNPEKPERKRRSRGGRGGADKAADEGNKVCKWFNTAEGCRRGKECPFSHE